VNMFDPKNWKGCEAILDRLHEFLNQRELTRSDVDDIRRHLKECPPCGNRYEFEEHLLERLKKSEPCQCPERLRSRIKALLDLA
jgi:anti-sigma factor (TIGR02949 family)